MNSLNNLSNIAEIVSVFVFPVIFYFVRKLNKEMHNNGGSTVKDAIDRIEADVKKQRKQLKRLAADLNNHLSDFE
jgi:preprotein translocase subunit SecF